MYSGIMGACAQVVVVSTDVYVCMYLGNVVFIESDLLLESLDLVLGIQPLVGQLLVASVLFLNSGGDGREGVRE